MLRYVLPALAVAGMASAACSVSGTTTVQNSGDATALASCTTFSGSIAVATGTTDNIALDGIQVLKGSLVANNATTLAQLSAADMQSISGSFDLQDLTILGTLNFPQLTSVNEINWITLPALQSLSFNTGVQTCNSLNIQNTFLASLDGISLTEVGTFYVTNNRYLDDVTLQVKNISDAFTLGENGPKLSASFPHLSFANNMTFRNVTSVSIPALGQVGGSLGFYGNYFSSIAAPNLTITDGSLALVSNTDLTNISFPLLKQIGGALQVANNTELTSITFPALFRILGALDFYGNFSSVSLPQLSDVRGAFNIQSSADITSSCNHFDSMHGSSSAIKGTYTCEGTVSNPGGVGSTPTSSGHSSSNTGAAGHLDVSSSAVMGLSGVLAALFGLL